MAEVIGRSFSIHCAILAIPGAGRQQLLHVIERCSSAFRNVIVVPDLFGMSTLWVMSRDLGGILGLELRHNLLVPLNRVAKRLLDLAGGTMALLATAPLIAGFRLGRRFDCVVASSPPPFLGVSGWLLARFCGAPFILDVRDLWPGLAVALGELKSPVAIWGARRLEEFLYERADGIAAVTQPFCSEIRERLKSKKPVELVMNGTTEEFMLPADERNRLRQCLGWTDDFVVLYAGNVGVCQGLEHLVEAA